MKATGKITFLGEVQRGTSAATGNPWQAQDVVIEIAEETGTSHLALKTFSENVIGKLAKAELGMTCEVDFFCSVTARTFTRRDGTEAVVRENNIGIKDVTLSF